MANIKSAQKKLRQDLVQTKLNLLYKNRYKKAIKVFLEKPSQKLLQAATSVIDKAAKKKVIDKNKAARLKSNLAKKLKK
jgi:small subunit ribosomal protein S20